LSFLVLQTKAAAAWLDQLVGEAVHITGDLHNSKFNSPRPFDYDLHQLVIFVYYYH